MMKKKSGMTNTITKISMSLMMRFYFTKRNRGDYDDSDIEADKEDQYGEEYNEEDQYSVDKKNEKQMFIKTPLVKIMESKEGAVPGDVEDKKCQHSGKTGCKKGKKGAVSGKLDNDVTLYTLMQKTLSMQIIHSTIKKR